MARTASNDITIAQRIKARRKLLGWSIRHAASTAGVHNATWGRIEKGEISADNRITLAKIAAALRCSTADLTGQPPTPVDRDQAETGGAVYETMRAVIEADLNYPPTTGPVPLDALHQELELVRDLRARCDYAAAARRLPDLLRGLHAAAYGDDRHDALRQLVIAEDTASFVVRYAGHAASACLVADRALQAAERLDDPVMLGLAAWSRAHAATGCGLYSRALTIAEHATQTLTPHATAPDGPEMLGQLYMTQAFALYALGRVDDAVTLVDEAETIAARTGESDALKLMFGPTNIAFWRVSMEADGDSPGRAIEIARTVNPQLVASISRQFAFYSDLGRAMAHTGRDRDALRMLLIAERLGPQRMRSPLVLETVRGLLERARRGHGWTELRGLCERLDIAA